MNTRNVIEILLTAKNQLTSPIRSAGAALQKFHGQITAISTGFLAFRQVGQDVAGAFDALVGQTIRSAREFQAFENRLGISAGTLSELKYVAELNNVQFSQLAIGMQRMTRRVAEAAQGLGEAQGAIKELGLDATKLNQLPLEQQFAAVADALSGVGSQSDRVRLAFKLFDSEGVSLLQTMRGGAEEMRRLREEARQTGAAMSDSMIRDADEAARKLKAVEGAITGIKNAIAEGILAEISEADIKNLTEMFKSAAGFAGKTTIITIEAIGDIGGSFREAGNVLQQIGDFLAGKPIRESLFGKEAVAEVDALSTGLFDLKGGSEQLNRAWLEFLKSAGLVARTLRETEGAGAGLEARMKADAEAAQKAAAARKAQAAAQEGYAKTYSAWIAEQNARLEKQIMYQRDGVWYVREAGDEAAELGRHVAEMSGEASAWQKHLEAGGRQLDGIRTRIEIDTEATRQWRKEMEEALAPTSVEKFIMEAFELERLFGDTLVRAVGNFADRLGSSLATALVYTKRFHEAAKEAWKSFVASVIAEVNRLIARQIIAAALSIYTSGGSVAALARGVEEAVGAAETAGRYQAGGIVPGYGSGDRMLIRAEPGEAVLPKELTALLLRAARNQYSYGESALAYAYQPPRAASTVNIFAQSTLGGRAEALELARVIAGYMREAGAMA